MQLTYSNFLEILNYKEIEHSTLFQLIATNLSIQLFKETTLSTTYTLSSTTFVLDISDSASKLYFVDENLKFEYIEEYFNETLKKRDYKMFYYFLKHFMKYVSAEQPSNKNDSNLKRCRILDDLNVCECVFEDNKCDDFNLTDITPEYNIFTHKTEKHIKINGFMFKIENDDVIDDVKQNPLFYSILPSIKEKVDEINIGNVLIKKDLSVYVNGVLNKGMRYLLNTKKDIKFVIDFFKSMN